MDLHADIINLLLDLSDESTRRNLGSLNRQWQKVYSRRLNKTKFKHPTPITFKSWYDFMYAKYGKRTNNILINLVLFEMKGCERWEMSEFFRKYPQNPLFKYILTKIPKEKDCALGVCHHCHGSIGLEGPIVLGYSNIF